MKYPPQPVQTHLARLAVVTMIVLALAFKTEGDEFVNEMWQKMRVSTGERKPKIGRGSGICGDRWTISIHLYYVLVTIKVNSFVKHDSFEPIISITFLHIWIIMWYMHDTWEWSRPFKVFKNGPHNLCFLPDLRLLTVLCIFWTFRPPLLLSLPLFSL